MVAERIQYSRTHLDDKYLFQVQPIADLNPYPHNSRTHSDAQITQVVNSITEFGFTNPILIDENKTIIAGHCRLLAAQRIGLTDVPCVTLSGLSEAQKKAYVIADNKLALNAGWDFEVLLSEVQALKDAEYNFELTGFTHDEIEDLTPDIMSVGLTDDDAVPEAPEEPITKLGDIYTLGNHRLMCGDSTMIDSVDKLMNGENPIAMITDPPYGVEYDPTWRDDSLGVGKRSKGKVENDHIVDWKDAYSLFQGNICYVWHAGKYTHVVAQNLIDCNFELVSQIIWAKNNFAISRGDYHWKHEPCWYAVRKGEKHNWNGKRDQSTLWEIRNTHQKGENEKVGHGTQNPVEIMMRPIENNTNANDGVYDPFGGSGTTLIACEKLNRKCYMMELSPQYCDVIVKRWEQFTGKKAVLENANV